MGRERGAGVWGPYEYKPGKWRLLQRTGDGRVASVPVASRAAGERIKAEYVARWHSAGLTVATAIEDYEAHLRDEKKNKPKSYRETVRRLRLFFAAVLEVPLRELTPVRARGLYEGLTKRAATAPAAADEDEKAPKGGKRVATQRLLSVDTCRNMLAEARTFLRYAIDRGWVKANALEGVKGKGRRSHGKAQLRIDEARLWLQRALELAPTEPGAVAALCTVVLGMRASEIVSRQVRDLDDNGRLMWIADAGEFSTKTDAAKRTQEIDPELQVHLVALAQGKPPTALLFGKHWRDWPREWVQRICREAKVPEVTAHGMRGLRATLGILGGVGAALKRSAGDLGHAHESTTAQSYVAPGTLDAEKGRVALAVLRGGKR